MNLRPSVALWRHQDDMSSTVAGRDLTLALAGCGVGKTLAALVAAQKAGARRTLILTIKPGIEVWGDEIADKLDIDGEVLLLNKGTVKDKRVALERQWDDSIYTRRGLIVVTNYESARQLDLGDFRWHYAVADESHRLKSHGSKQSETLAIQLQDVPHKLAMTGTAWEDRPTDVWGQVRWLEPKKNKNGNGWGTQRFGSWSSFFEEYVVYRTVDNIKIPVRYKNLDQLQGMLADIFYYIDRDAVLDLPPVQHIERRVTLEKSHMKAYKELERELALTLGPDEVTAENPLVLNLKLHQIAGGFYQPDGEDDVRELRDGDAKLNALLGIAEEIGDEPFVIFTRFREDVSRIAAGLKTLGISTKVLVGGRDQHRAWKAGESQALIANIQAGSASVNLTRAAYAVFYSTGYSNTDYTQALYRIDRPGQTRPVTIFHIIARDTVDEDIRTALKSKDETASKLLGEFTGDQVHIQQRRRPTDTQGVGHTRVRRLLR